MLDTGHGVRNGVDEIQRVMEGLHRYEATFHLLGQSRVDGGPETATGETYCDAHHLMVEEVGGAEVRTDTVMKIRYVDQLTRTGDGWRIGVRRLHVDWIADHRLD